MTRLISLAASVLILSSCAPLDTSPAAKPANDLAFGETGYADGPYVRPLSVLQDSRCPKSVQCVWAGTVIVRTEVRGGNWAKTLNLELGKPQPVADGAMTLVAVRPERLREAAIDQSAYRFDYRFEGGL